MAQSLPKTFKAAVLTEPKGKLEIKDVPMLEAKEGEILSMCYGKMRLCDETRTSLTSLQSRFMPVASAIRTAMS